MIRLIHVITKKTKRTINPRFLIRIHRFPHASIILPLASVMATALG
jgi:hypothetical protein